MHVGVCEQAVAVVVLDTAPFSLFPFQQELPLVE